MKFLKKLFKRRDHLREHRVKAIEIVNKIKHAVDSEFLTDVTRITRSKVDDRALAFVRGLLPKILAKLNLTERIDPEVAVYDSIQQLKKYPPEDRGLHYLTIAGDIYSSFSGLPLDTAMHEVQKEYDVIYPQQDREP